MTHHLGLREAEHGEDQSRPVQKPETERLEPATKPLALPGLAVASKQMSFDWTLGETISFATIVYDIKKEHLRCTQAVAAAQQDMAERMPPEMLKSYASKLMAIGAALADFTKAKVKVADRENVQKLLAAEAKKLDNLFVDAEADIDRWKEVEAAEQKRQREAAEAKAAQEKKEREDAEAKAAEDKKQKEAAEAKAAEEKKQQEAAEAKAAEDKKQQEAAEAKAAEEKKQREEAEAKAAEDKKQQEAAEAKAAEEKKQREEAEAKAAEDKKQQEAAEAKAAEEKKQRDKEAAEKRRAAFGHKEGAFNAAEGAAKSATSDSFNSEIGALGSARSKAMSALPTVPKVKKPNAKSIAATREREAGERSANEVYDAGEKAATETRSARMAVIVEALGGVATSGSGTQLSEEDLAWVMTASGGRSSLAQALADLAFDGGLALAKGVAADNDAEALAKRCSQLLAKKVGASKVLAGARLMGNNGTLASWLLTLAGTPQFDDAVSLAGQYPKNLATVASVGAVLGVGSEGRDLVEAVVKLKVKADDVAWLLSLAASPGNKDLYRVIRNREPDVAHLRVLVAAAGTRFTLTEIAAICERNTKTLVTAAELLPNVDAHSVNYVGLWIAVSGGKELDARLKQAVRAEGLLADNHPGFSITVEKDDRQYGRGDSNPYRVHNATVDARTGFLLLNFPDGSIGYLHSHWDAKGAKQGAITSMHVQNGDNGKELNEWQAFFPKLLAAVVSTLNARTPKPTGGTLKLALTKVG